MPRKRAQPRPRRPAHNPDEIAWLLAEPYTGDDFDRMFISHLYWLDRAMAGYTGRDELGKLYEQPPLKPEDVKPARAHYGTLKRLKAVYDDLPADVRNRVPKDRKALIDAVEG